MNKTIGRWRELSEAFGIFATTVEGNLYWNNIRAEDGGLWGGPHPELLSEKQRKRLKDMGWTNEGTHWTYRL